MMHKKTLAIVAGIVVPLTICVAGALISLSNSVAVAQAEIKGLHESVRAIKKTVERIDDKMDDLRFRKPLIVKKLDYRVDPACPFTGLPDSS